MLIEIDIELRKKNGRPASTGDYSDMGQDAVSQSMRRRDGGDGYDWFFLAITHARLSDEDRATQWHDLAQSWFKKQRSLDDELMQTQAVAATVFGR